MNDFLNSRFVKEVSEITNNMYHQGWDERNGGNISYLIDEEYVREYFPKDKFILPHPSLPDNARVCFFLPTHYRFF